MIKNILLILDKVILNQDNKTCVYLYILAVLSRQLLQHVCTIGPVGRDTGEVGQLRKCAVGL